jgi:hypothetical protein
MIKICALCKKIMRKTPMSTPRNPLAEEKILTQPNPTELEAPLPLPSTSETPDEKTHVKTIKVVSLDGDGSTFNKNYDLKKEDSFLTANEKLINKIKSDLTEQKINKLIFMVGSNRQSIQIDQLNSKRNKTESFFTALVKFTEKFEKEHKEIEVVYDGVLADDLYENRPAGQTFDNAIKKVKSKVTYNRMDRIKVSILYLQMQKIASENPNAKIIFDFYDDTTDTILNPLKTIFEAHPDLIPKNVSLGLYHYAGKEITPAANIQGTGVIDNAYRETFGLFLENTSRFTEEGATSSKIYEMILQERETLYKKELEKQSIKTEKIEEFINSNLLLFKSGVNDFSTSSPTSVVSNNRQTLDL